MNAEKVLDEFEHAKLRELQNQDQSIINLKNSRRQSVIADKDNRLRMKVDYKGDILEAILVPKVLRSWIITSTHINSVDIKVETTATTKFEQHTSGVA